MDAPGQPAENNPSFIRSRIAALEQEVKGLRRHLKDSSDLIEQLKQGCDTLEAIIVTAEHQIALLRKDIERLPKPQI